MEASIGLNWQERIKDLPSEMLQAELERRKKQPRKHTKFQICERHQAWFAGATRSRKAEVFVEGGPGGMSGCKGGKCKLWPGRDFYVEEICHGEYELDWSS